jgi:hypothetical protein
MEKARGEGMGGRERRAKRNDIARRSAVIAWMATLLLAVCLPVAPAVAAEGSCANEARRGEQSSSYLPDCRAYEQVTPVAKDAGEPAAVVAGLLERSAFEPTRGARAAVDGDRMAWVSEYSLAGVTGASTLGLDYLSTRGSEGWSTEATLPPQSPENGLLCPNLNGIVGWSSNLTKGILNDGDAQEFDQSGVEFGTFHGQAFACGHAEPALREAGGAEIEEPRGFQNLFLRDSETATYRLVNVTPAAAPHPTPREGIREEQDYFPPNFLAGSADLGHVAFEDELPLSEEAEKLSPTVEAACKEEPKGRLCWEGHDDLYVWIEASQPAVRLVTVLPDGAPVEGALAGSTRSAGVGNPGVEIMNVADYRHAASADGSRIFFESEGNLYVRENGGEPQSALGGKGECVEAAKACTIQLDLPQGGKGIAGGGGKWLGANAEGTRVFFTDDASEGLTSTTVEGSGANLYEYQLPSAPDTSGTLVDLTPAASAEVLGMSGVSEDGSYVYFVAEGKLAGNYDVVGRSSAQPEPIEGADNLYVSHEGAITFIGTLSGEDLCDWTSNTGCNVAQPGNPSISGLTARVSGNGRYLAFNSVSQLTGYDNTDTVTKKADEEIFTYEAEDGQLACVSCDLNGTSSAGGAAIDWPAQPDTNALMSDTYPQRNVSEAGQVFFETSEALLPQQDTNGVRDVYEYERGVLHLISSGTSSAPSYFLDATPSGSDVFVATAQKLLRRDTESTYEIYDARVGGGFAEPPSPAPPCESECKGSAGAPPAFSTPSSTTFTGSGNVVQTKTSTKLERERLRAKLRACRKRFPHNAHRRARCERRARVSGRAKPRRASVSAGRVGR